jgi:hypothetical protein
MVKGDLKWQMGVLIPNQSNGLNIWPSWAMQVTTATAVKEDCASEPMSYAHPLLLYRLRSTWRMTPSASAQNAQRPSDSPRGAAVSRN